MQIKQNQEQSSILPDQTASIDKKERVLWDNMIEGALGNGRSS